MTAKLQAKVAAQAREITRLQRELAATKDNMADIKAQRDDLRDEKRARIEKGAQNEHA